MPYLCDFERWRSSKGGGFSIIAQVGIKFSKKLVRKCNEYLALSFNHKKNHITSPC